MGGSVFLLYFGTALLKLMCPKIWTARGMFTAVQNSVKRMQTSHKTLLHKMKVS